MLVHVDSHCPCGAVVTIVAAILAVLLLGYLVVAVVKPEKF
ncbi:K+-transporting ATPase KdpF subunit [Nakamurella sp. UYEF19]